MADSTMRRAHLALGLLLASTATAQRTSTNEVAHYSFRYQECESMTPPRQFTDSVNPTSTPRALAIGMQGLYCMDGPPPHLGVNLNLTRDCDITADTCPTSSADVCSVAPQPLSACTFDPARSGCGQFAAGLTAGFTIEAWLNADPDFAQTRVIASLATRCPSIQSGSGTATDPFGHADRYCRYGREQLGSSTGPEGSAISFRLLQTAGGCIALEFKTPAAPSRDPNCVVMPPLNAFCTDDPTGTNLVPGSRLNVSTSRPQHVVVSVGSVLGVAPVASAPSRFTVYIDGVDVTNSEERIRDARSNQAEGELSFGQATADASFHTLWSPNHVLRVGSDGYGGTPDGYFPWYGQMYMLSMYSSPLSPAEVQANYAAGLDNSAPYARDAAWNVTEDSCTQLPSLDAFVSDWDRDGELQRAQSLTTELTGLPTSGTLHTDSACATAAVADPAALASVSPTSLYYQPPRDVYSLLAANGHPAASSYASGMLATIAWRVSDGAGGTDSAVLSVGVSDVNDAPVAWDSAASVYMAIPSRLTVNGTDVDGEDASDPIGRCAIRITQLPIFGTLHEALPDGTYAPTALALDATVQNTTVVYISQAFEGTAGMRVVAEDEFRFLLIDASSAVSTASARVAIAVLSGLESVSAPVTVREEVMSPIRLEGINQRGGATWFVVLQLPKNGTLYQYDPTGGVSGAGGAGAPIESAPANVSAAAIVPCASRAGFSCATLLYQGDVDYFSYPSVTRDGVALNISDDTLIFDVRSSVEVSANATVTIRVENVNDLPTIVAPRNVTFRTSSQPGENWDRVGASVSIVDRDRGVGFYQIGLSVTGGDSHLTELAFKQPGVGGNVRADRWQWRVDAIQDLLAATPPYIRYCPPMCEDAGSCRNSGCIRGQDGSLEPVIRVFATPATAQTLIRNVLYSGDDAPGQTFTIEIDDFDDQVRAPSPPPPGQPAPPAVDAVIQLIPNVVCASNIGCDNDFGGGSGVEGCSGEIATAVGGLCLGVVLLLWLFVCCRQRARTGSRDSRGRRKPRSEQAPSDMRCFVPLIATLGLFFTLSAFILRSEGSPFSLFRMDIYGDGYCGPNATNEQFFLSAAASSSARRLSDGSGANANASLVAMPIAPPSSASPPPPLSETSVGINNRGCTGGVPEGFMLRSMLGDLLVVGLVGPLLIIEVSGRTWGRLLASIIAAVVFLLAMIKLAIFDAIEAQLPEGPPPNCPRDEVGVPLCPNFIQRSPAWTADDPGSPVLSSCGPRSSGSDTLPTQVRPFQSSFYIAVLPALMLPALLVITCAGLCRVYSRIRGGGDDDDESDEEDDRRRRKDRDRHKSSHHRERKETRHRTRQHDGRDGEHGRTRRRRDEEEDHGEKPPPPARAKPHGEKPPPPAHKPPPPSRPPPGHEEASEHTRGAKGGKKGGVRAPRVPGKARLGFQAKKVETTMVEIALTETNGSVTAPQPPQYAPPPPIEWFYMDLDNVQLGPVDAAALNRLYQMGDIHDFSFVWHEALANWQALRDTDVLQQAAAGNFVSHHV